MNRVPLYVAVVTIGAAAAVALAGCHKTIPQQAGSGSGSTRSAGAGAGGANGASGQPNSSSSDSSRFGSGSGSGSGSARALEQEAFARQSLQELNAGRPLADVFFDTDRSDIRDDARALLSKNAEWVRKFASASVTIEGYCDSRGSSEYNLALGSRRADAVKSYMVSLGVPSDRITLVSKGKEQQFCMEQSEDCWQENRRGHFLVTAK